MKTTFGPRFSWGKSKFSEAAKARMNNLVNQTTEQGERVGREK